MGLTLIEEICDTPAEIPASQDPGEACRRGGLADSQRKGSGFLKSAEMISNKKLQA